MHPLKEVKKERKKLLFVNRKCWPREGSLVLVRNDQLESGCNVAREKGFKNHGG